MNWLERSIAAISPRMAERRAMSRVRLQSINAIERRQARQTRASAGTFDLNSGNPDDARPRRYLDRATVLRLASQNPYGKKALNALVNNAVGWGITGTPKGPKGLSQLWQDWVKVSDYRGRLNFYGQQELAIRTMFRQGEVFIVRRWVKGATVLPFRIQLVDAGLLATEKFGDNIEDGIQYDGDGNVAGYWFHQARQRYRGSKPPAFFKAEDVIHLFIEEEVGLKRGVSVFEPVVKRLDDIDETLDADLVRRKIDACFAGFRTLSPDADDRPTGEREEQGDGRPPLDTIEPGMLFTLEQGEDIKFSDPKPAGGLGDAVKIQLLAAAAGMLVTYEHMTGDLSNVNFSSYRAGALEFDTFISRVQWNTLIPVGLDRVWDWFCQAAYEFGRTGKRSYEIRWAPPPRKTIDRLGDAKADQLEMELGLENRRALLAARGIDHDTHLEETARDLAFQREKNLYFQGDPAESAAANAANSGRQA